METKKILLYTGGAIVLGAVGFFVWSFFQKVEIPLGNTTITLGSDSKDKPADDAETETETDTKDKTIPPIVAENTSSGGRTFNPNVNNPFQVIEDDSDYSELDALIHKGR
jgi:hypothetical protein